MRRRRMNPVECSAGELFCPQPDTRFLVEYVRRDYAMLARTERVNRHLNDFPEHAGCCCERLHQRKSVSVVRLSDDLNNSDVWSELKLYIQSNTPDVATKVLYMCSYCKALIKKNRMPARCVLNGLQTVPIPPELAVLDPLSRQLIQRAKCYQTIARLGTYTAKVPTYNSLKACKGTMFFLPLPLKRTLETLDDGRSHVYCLTQNFTLL